MAVIRARLASWAAALPSVGVVPARWCRTTPRTRRETPATSCVVAQTRLPPAGVEEPVFSPMTPSRPSSLLVLRKVTPAPGAVTEAVATIRRKAGSFIAARASRS